MFPPLRKNILKYSLHYCEILFSGNCCILQDEGTGKMYRIPSQMSLKAGKLYQVFGVKRSLQPHELAL